MSKIQTSKMKALLEPNRYGLTVIDQIFGVYRPRQNQMLVLEGELVKDQKGRVHRFVYKQDNSVFVEPV